MRFLISLALSAICIALIAAAPMPHQHHGHSGDGHGEASSYIVVTKHASKHDDHKGHQGHDAVNHGYDHHEEHKVEHHGNNGHDDDDGHHEHHGHAKYEFEYGVKDTKTGDIKDQWESRDGDKVKGTYSLKESDGTTRIVNYTSDKKTGFEATVHKIGHAHHSDKGDHGHHGNNELHHGHEGHGKASSFILVKKHK